MFWFLAVTTLFIDVVMCMFLDTQTNLQWVSVEYQLFAIATCGWMAAKNPSQKRTAAMLVMSVAAFWVLITDWAIPYMPSGLQALESSIFLVMLAWSAMRPYDYHSDALTTDTVCLLFYRHSGGGMLMNLFGLLGLPVTSMSVVAGEYWLKLIRGQAYLQKDLAVCIDEKRYIIVDTGVPVSSRIHELFNELRGEPARTPMSLWLRLRCIASIKPLLRELGEYYVPRNVWQQIPAIYFYKFTGNRRG